MVVTMVDIGRGGWQKGSDLGEEELENLGCGKMIFGSYDQNIGSCGKDVRWGEERLIWRTQVVEI